MEERSDRHDVMNGAVARPIHRGFERDRSYFHFFVLVEAFPVPPFATVNPDKVAAIVQDRRIWAAAAKEAWVVSLVPRLFPEFTNGGRDRFLARVDHATGDFPGKIACSVAKLTNQNDLIVVCHRQGHDPVWCVNDVEVPLDRVPLTQHAVPVDGENPAIGNFGLFGERPCRWFCRGRKASAHPG